MTGSFAPRLRAVALLTFSSMMIAGAAMAQRPSAPGPAPLGTPPPAAALPRAEFVFEERVTLAPAVVLGDTDLGHRQYIPITGGTIAGPKFKGTVVPGGWDFQLQYAGGCGSLSADYFLRAEDGTLIHVLNQGFNCASGGGDAGRNWTRPTFEAPKGSAYEWLTRGTFVGALELEPPATPPPPGTKPPLAAIRIKFYQIK